MISVKISSNALTSAAQSPRDPGDRLVLGELQVEREQVEDVLLRPVRIGAGEERGDRLDVRGPARVVGRERRLIAGLGGRDEVDRDEDVLLEQLGQPVTGGLPVEAGDRGTDVLLVPEQSPAAASASGVPATAATMYSRVQMT